ncbi:MAG: SprT family zinc-dependent metalloprotease [Treponemataceae bacterium]
MKRAEDVFNISICGKSVNAQRKKVKTLRLKIDPKTAELFCSVPESMSLEKVSAFIEAHLDWIEKNQQAVLEKNKKNRTAEAENTVLLFGKTYSLTKHKASRFSYKVYENEIILNVRNFTNEEITRCCNLMYAKELNAFVESQLPELEALMKEKVAGINYRTMKTKLGSCNPVERKITLNTRLACYAPDCVRMVLIHEMVHFKEFYHNERFKNLMTLYCPDWRALKKSMKQQ